MSRPLHETLRALGQGMVVGTVVAVPLGFALVYITSPGGLVAAGLGVGAGLITIANALKRRDQRKAKVERNSVSNKAGAAS